MEQCKDCLRNAPGGCEAYKKPFEGCWARETDPQKYIKEQKDIIAYNKGYQRGATMARKSIKRVKGMIE